MEEKLKEEKKISLVLYPKKITDTGNGGNKWCKPDVSTQCTGIRKKSISCRLRNNLSGERF